MNPRTRFVARPPARSTVLLDGPRSRTTEWRFAPGAHTGWHVHAYPYVVVPMTDGVLALDTPDGPRESALRAGASYAREAGVEHDVINANDHEFVFVEIELKRG
jgi:quercetin dioxygenase-like cupin family protein